MEIIGCVKTYDWGKLGTNSAVAQLAELNTAVNKPEQCTPYAELWMGDHPTGPSSLKTTGSPLSSVLKDQLPYLFKVLSIRKALSIQVHPNKAEAFRLHNEKPDIYKDPNHKPELAIALTPFLALCGFRPYCEIYQFCEELHPLKNLLGTENVELLKNGTETNLRACYEKLMTASPEDVVKCIDDIGKKYVNVLVLHNLKDIFITINNDFPGDVGILSLFFLNFIRLKPGEAIFLAANEIHAYLSGDCIECMACSDNVIRAGLTPKYKDVAQLIACLNYKGQSPEKKIFKPRILDEHLCLFIPPVEDFAVAQLTIPSSLKEYNLNIKPLSSILLVLQGERSMRSNASYDFNIKRGSIVYIPPEAAPTIRFFSNENENKEDFIAYIAMPNAFIPKKC